MKKRETANKDQMRETKSKSKNVSVSVKSQKQKAVVKEVKPVEKEVKSLKEEDLLLDSGTDSDYDGDSLSGSLNSDDFDSDIFDSEDDGSQRETEDGDRESSKDEVHGIEGSDDNDDEGEQVDSENGEEDGSGDEGSEQDEVAEESDSSEDEVAPRNTVGDVPLEWYKDEKHIGYDITGKKITKKEKQDKLDSFLATMDDSKNWRKIYDEYNDEEVELTKEESKLIRRMLKGEAPHADFDPYTPYVDWFKWDDAIHPLSSAPEPKRRFIPSKWEAKKVVKYVRAIRKGLIKFDKPEEEPNVYLLWGDDSTSDQKSKHLTYIPPPKLKLPGHEESYNPSLEYIPTEEEKASYELMYEEDRPNFIPTRFASLRSIPAYPNALKESFNRCLDLYLCPRVRKKRINIDPESLKPKLPSRKDLRPYPNSCYLEYKGHTGAVTSISTECSGQWIASGSTDGSVRLWEVETGRCLKIWQFDEAVKCVAWNPLSDFPILAVAMGRDLVILNTELGTDEEQKNIKDLLQLGDLPEPKAAVAAIVSWLPDELYGGIKIRHFKNISNIDWHRKGDYLSTVMASGETRGVVIHQISKKVTTKPYKIRGLPVSAVFHPSRSYLFIATKKNVRVYNLLTVDEPVKKLETGMREISSMAIHPGGDNLIVGSKEGKMCWFDMDLSSKPYKTLKNHPKDITNVAYHRSYPLFASSSEDSTAYVFHGKVFNDLNENPLIVPLEILRGHSSSNGGGVLDCKFHPRQPWLFTAGADSIIKLYCH
ncbi:ribosome biogenesis protein BOP1 homolog [Eutrema salsugineum]|nr:ribosome biogenesis protein BOP1 homolog [Eutrema salsugineum]